LLAVEADGVHLVDERDGVEALAEIEHGRDVGLGARHRVDRLEDDHFDALGGLGGEQLLEVREIVVTKDDLGQTAGANALDETGVILLVRENERVARQNATERLHDAEIGRVARVKEKSGIVVAHLGELGLESAVNGLRARDVARATGASALLIDRSVHGGADRVVMAQIEIVVRAPIDDPALAKLERSGESSDAVVAVSDVVSVASAHFTLRRLGTVRRGAHSNGRPGGHVGRRGELHADKRMHADDAAQIAKSAIVLIIAQLAQLRVEQRRNMVR
jgi:hypothetical protein